MRELMLFHPYFVCKCSFREISMIKIVILDQSKPISLILNKTNIQPILKSNSTSFMFFCEMNIKKIIHWGGGVGNGGTVLISSWKCN